MALVEPPRASTVVTALSNDAGVKKSSGLMSCQTISTTCLPLRLAIWAWRESGAGIEAAPGRVKPSTSTALVMVLAVPMVMQWPGLRAIPSSTSCQSCSLMLPARSSAQYFQVSLPLPKAAPL